MDLRSRIRNLRPYILMVLLQFGFAGIHIISVATLKTGMSHYVLVVYRNIVAVAVVAPFALWFERKTRPKMTIAVFLKIMAMALMEVVLDQNLYYIGVQFTSASFAAALIKIPAIPFIMALVLRIEKVKLRQRSHQAKVVGNLITVAGALIMIFYKGPIIEFIWSTGGSYTDGANEGANWLLGTLALLASAVCFSGFIFLQSNTLKSYPANLSLTTLICLVGTIMSTAVALITENGKVDAWIIGWDSRLFAAVYSGILCTGVAYYVQGVVMKERDAVFVTAFNPLCMIIVVFLGSIILAEVVTLGSLLGITIIIIGLYFFIWGKSKDHVNPNLNTNTKEALELPKTKNIGDGNLASVGDVIVVVDIATTISEDNLNEAGECVSTDFTSLVVEIPEDQTSGTGIQFIIVSRIREDLLYDYAKRYS